ncbi:hypothetical protein D3C72_1500630 [compost metagenome]
MLQLAQRAVGVGDLGGQLGVDQPQLAAQAQQGDIARVGRQLRILRRMLEHQVLHHEFNVDHAARILLQIEAAVAGRMGIEHLLAHGHHFALERAVFRAFLAQDRVADALEMLADGGVAGAKARARERLVLPHPGRAALVALERLHAGDQHARGAVGAQGDVDVEQNAGRGVRGHPGNEALRQLGVQARRFLVVVVEEENDVEVRDITEFLAAQLAIRDDGEFRHVAVACG